MLDWGDHYQFSICLSIYLSNYWYLLNLIYSFLFYPGLFCSILFSCLLLQLFWFWGYWGGSPSVVAPLGLALPSSIRWESRPFVSASASKRPAESEGCFVGLILFASLLQEYVYMHVRWFIYFACWMDDKNLKLARHKKHYGNPSWNPSRSTLKRQTIVKSWNILKASSNFRCSKCV